MKQLNSLQITKKEALEYHSKDRNGKIEVIPTKSFKTSYDLSLAYTPGVAYPCLEIQKNSENAYLYTAKSNLVAVITNGTAVLGLGNIGALASKPVMEGKGILFKRFADIDVFDIEVDEKDPDRFCEIVKSIYQTFGGINLEDIKAPECFYIEERLSNELDIPVFHDDQHGTALVSASALLNALYLVGKSLKDVKIVINGAGASGIATGKILKLLGAKNIIMCDSKGVITADRNDLNKYKKEFAVDTDKKELRDVIKDADVFIGLSKGGVLTEDMIKSMATNPIIFALANPTPEIFPEEAEEIRDDVIIATGRSDYPNQINNVLVFPFIFRGSLDVRAKKITEDMKIAVVKELSKLAREPVPTHIKEIYGEDLYFGKNYLIPKPFDERLLINISTAVAKSAILSGVSHINIENFNEEEYKKVLINKHLNRIKNFYNR
ncbi:MAG: malate dehydrogenase [Persephonella sp.]|nr:MAG: malate dehydrogenase [Persephonella sp.]